MITSIENKKIKLYLNLKKNKQVKKKNLFVIEGIHLLKEALASNVVKEIFLTDKIGDEYLRLNNFSKYKTTIITENIAKYLSETIHNQGIFAICEIKKKKLKINNYKNIIILDRIQDPGNLGTIVRNADAFGFDCVLLGKGCASLYSQKAIRSMQGSNFHIDCYENIDIIEQLLNMKEFDIISTALNGSIKLSDLDKISEKYAIIFGNEGNGIEPDIIKKSDYKIKIDMKGKAESLNVAISSGIIMYYLKNILK